ncbi:MAG TPA: Fur family transcriptional regulator [Methylophilaceae bacterium]|jgi:Fur family ferric uptake transcriptional regulator
MIDTIPDAYADLAYSIHAVGARATPARMRALGALRHADQPLSHADIEAELSAEKLPLIDRVTLYRVLEWLTEVGLAHKVVDFHGVFRFSANTPDAKHTQHAHFRCTDCGRVTCLDEPVPELPHLPRGFRLARVELDIQGECADCVASH